MPQISIGLYVSLLDGFESAANACHSQAIICNTGDSLHKQGDELFQLLHKQVGGVALVPVSSAPTPTRHVEALERAGIPVVLLHRDVAHTNAPLIALPLYEVGYEAGERIARAGHRRTAIVTGQSGTPSTRPQSEGFEKALIDHGIDESPILVHLFTPQPSDFAATDAAIATAVDEWLSLPLDQRPTAVFATNDVFAEFVFMRLMARGLRVPEDISLVSFGGQDRLGPIAGRLTRITVDEITVGRQAVELFGQALDRRGRIARTAPITFRTGHTLATCPARSVRPHLVN